MPTIHCILGRVSSPTPDVTVDGKKALRNSSKWIFDVVHEMPALGTAAPSGRPPAFTFEVHLLDYTSGRLQPKGVYSPHAVPLNEGASRARVYFPDPDKLTISCDPRYYDPERVALRFRVTVDALHTLMR